MFLTYRYAFTAKEKTQIGAALGIGLIFLRTEITATAGVTAGGPDTAIAQFSPKGSINGPNASLGGTVVSSSATDGTWRVTCGRSTSRSTTSRPV